VPRRNTRIFIGIIILTALALFLVWPRQIDVTVPGVGPFKRDVMRLGLDLQGGTELVLQADLSRLEAEDRQPAMQSVLRIIDDRVNAFGVSEPVIQQQGENRISVQLAGVKDIAEAKKLIGQTARLEFVERTFDQDGNPTDTPTGLTGADLKRASSGLHPTNNTPIVNLEFTDQGAKIFEEVTTRLAGTTGEIAIFLDNEELTSPTVKQAISGGKAYIEGGNMTLESARILAIQLNAGALPVPLVIEKERSVDATLGADSVRKSILAGEIGLGIVLLFLLLYYRLPGFLAGLALVIYTILVLTIFKLWPVTLTLAGMAGFILSVGMAIDANVLIFERMKEEARRGKTPRAAIEAGFDGAWPAVRDSNISTFITCIILIWFGNSFGATLVKGFAYTLFIGVAVSMFSAIFITRTFLRLFANSRVVENRRLFGW